MKDILIIRRATKSDINAILLFEFRNKGWFSQFLPMQALKKQSLQYFISQLGMRDVQHYLVYLKNGVLIGRFCVQFLDSNRESLEVSYRIAKSCTNQGVAKYSLRRLLLIWASCGVKEVYANVGRNNKASIKVLDSCGFQHVGTDEEAIKLHTGVEDCLIYKWQFMCTL